MPPTRYSRLPCLGLLLALLAGCATTRVAPPARSLVLYGRVLFRADSSGVPGTGVVVGRRQEAGTLPVARTVSDAAGHYRLRVPVAGSPYQVALVTQGDTLERSEFTVPVPPTDSLALPLYYGPAPARYRYVQLYGRLQLGANSTTIFPSSELVLSGRLADGELASYRGAIQADGRYQLKVPAGYNYQVQINSNGRNVETREVNVPASTGDSLKLSFSIGLLATAAPSPLLPPLPLPLPSPSSRYVWPATFLRAAHTFGEADAQLTEALAAGDYTTSRIAYYSIPGGLALVTQLEQVDATGRYLPVPQRWDNGSTRPSFWQGLRTLAAPRPGRFRILVFIVSAGAVPTSATQAAYTRAQAERLLASGSAYLPDSQAAQALPAGCRVTALVYEYFKVDPAHPARLVLSQVPADTQLLRSNVRVPLSSPR